MSITQDLKNMLKSDDQLDREAKATAQSEKEESERRKDKAIADLHHGRKADLAAITSHFEAYPDNRKSREERLDESLKDYATSIRREELENQISELNAKQDGVRERLRDLRKLTRDDRGTHDGAGELAAKVYRTKPALDQAKSMNQVTAKLLAEYRVSQRAVEDAQDKILLLEQEDRALTGKAGQARAAIDSLPVPARPVKKSIPTHVVA
ncbi:hypothetical protein [Planctomycetes bacterium TBK1r]|uniref:Chromosome partition protein Smc n=1 Tax=Stieleria magnilauensis TaxID=2527963 RepID=A0ABX5XHG5_9BACT|nr:hypothetical protein TBK1r_03500 [Planctomycetes bacterium TBK1r]